MSVALIRHGLTRGNLERRYVGCRTDEPLCAAGISALRERDYPPVRRVFVSPMRRCVETATIIYPSVEPEIVEDFRECDFGAFEGLSYAELNGRADYQAWIDSGGALPFPGGECRASFARRCVAAFDALPARDLGDDWAIVAHGGTIMAIMARYAMPKGDYFDFQIPCGGGFVLTEASAGRNYRRLE